MNIRDFEYLLAINKYQHFGRAAESCSVSQPAMSMQIKKLEETLGVKLIERNNKSLYFTEIGDQVLEQARQIIYSRDKIKLIAKAFHDPLSGRVNLGVIPTIACYFYPQLSGILNKKLPKVDFYLYEKESEDLLKSLTNGDIDIAIMAAPYPGLEKFEQKLIYHESFDVCVPKQHKLAALSEITLNNLKNCELLLLNQGHCFTEHTKTACHELQIFSNYQASNLYTLVNMVKVSQGITIIPNLYGRYLLYTDEELKIIPLKAKQSFREVVLVTRKTYDRKQIMEHIAKIASSLNECS